MSTKNLWRDVKKNQKATCPLDKTLSTTWNLLYIMSYKKKELKSDKKHQRYRGKF